MTETEKDLAALCRLWRKHIASVASLRSGRSDVYLETMHTCHGCGAGAVPRLRFGLCDRCADSYEKLVGDENGETG